MTPAIHAARKAAIEFTVHDYAHDPGAGSYGLEAAAALGIAAGRVFKTLLVALNGDSRRLAVGIVPVDRQLDLKAMAAALGAKRVEMADPADAERATGYVVGGISPLGQKRRLPTRIDTSAEGYPTIFVSAGRRGLEIELKADDLRRLVDAEFAAIAR
ncbi:MAG: Cys-tRNA(Pro)/Cys-tRNA(Cys) deacylase YbaK [Gammaproteobacteria bacterium]